jgi:hypothetical protein
MQDFLRREMRMQGIRAEKNFARATSLDDDPGLFNVRAHVNACRQKDTVVDDVPNACGHVEAVEQRQDHRVVANQRTEPLEHGRKIELLDAKQTEIGCGQLRKVVRREGRFAANRPVFGSQKQTPFPNGAKMLAASYERNGAALVNQLAESRPKVSTHAAHSDDGDIADTVHDVFSHESTRKAIRILRECRCRSG